MGGISFASFELSTRKDPHPEDKKRRFDSTRWVTYCLQHGYKKWGEAWHPCSQNRTMRAFMIQSNPIKLQKILDRAWVWHRANFLYTDTDQANVYRYMVPYWTSEVEQKYLARLARDEAEEQEAAKRDDLLKINFMI